MEYKILPTNLNHLMKGVNKGCFFNKNVLNSASRWQTFDDIYGVVVFINHKISQLFLYVLLFFSNINVLLSILKIAFDFNWLKKRFTNEKNNQSSWNMQGFFWYSHEIILYVGYQSFLLSPWMLADSLLSVRMDTSLKHDQHR